MKKIIDGVLCDTEKAKFITGHMFPCECWELYQTETGEYFRYIEKEKEPDEISLYSVEDAKDMVYYTKEEKIICPHDVWKRKKRVFQEIKDYVSDHLYNPFKKKINCFLCVTERDGYLRIYNGRFFVCLGLEKGDFILDTDDLCYQDMDMVKDIRDHKGTILSMYYRGIKKKN